ncbi:MAG: polyprenyl diphosphate synthase, partial [Acidobacteriota bacterium]|nr:polyprenyl diphosphate synthase [Acidobacteriota bacterium]
MSSRIDLDRFPDLADEERGLLERLDPARLPRHVAVIMDGNGRWARERYLPRVAGHRAGIDAVRETVETAAQLGLECLTLYAFSHENWKRPRLEVSTLMSLLREYVIRERETLLRNDIRFRFIGRTEQLPGKALDAVTDAVRATAHCKGLTFTVALSYGGR